MTTKFLGVAGSEAILAFVEAKRSGASDQAAGQAARKMLEGALLQAFDQSGDLQKWKPLALPLSDLVADGEGLQLPLVAPSASHSATTGAWKWTLKTDASMLLVADVLDDDQLQTLGVMRRDGHQVVRYAVRGELGAGLSGGASAGVWSLKAGATASANAAMEWYVAAESGRRLGQALVEALPFMAPPMSLAAQLERAGDFDYWGSTVDLGGELSAAFSASADVSKTGWTWGFDGDKAKLGFTLGVSGSAKLRLAGQFRLRCVVKPAGQHANGVRYGLQVTLERLNTASSSLALALSAGVDATALARSADEWLRSHSPDPKQLDKSLELLTNPGTALGERLRGALEKAFADSKFKDLVLLSAGFGDAKAMARSLAARAAEPLSDEIDKLTGSLDDAAVNVGSLVDRWVARAFGGLPMSTQVRAALEQVAKEQLGDAKGRVDQALEELASRIESKTTALASGLLQPFATLGEKIQEQLQGVATKISASQASQAVRQGLAEYARLRKQVLSVLTDAQRAKITLALAGTIEQSQRSQNYFRATFIAAADPAPAERLFQALWSGRLDELTSLIADARDSGAIFGEPEGWLLRASQRVSSLSLSINLFGTSIVSKLVKTSDLLLQADLTGNVIASGKAMAQSDTRNYWTERQASLTLSVSRLGADVGGSVELAINGAYSARGRDLDRTLFDAMQRSLVRVMGASGSIDVRALLGGADAHSMSDKALLRDVAFLLPMSLQPGEFGIFLDADAADLRASVVHFGLRALDAEYEGQWDEAPSRFLRRLSQGLAGPFASDPDRLIACLDRFPSRWSRRASDMDNSVYENLGLDAGLMKDGSPLHAKLGTLFRLARLVHALPELQVQCRALRDLMMSARLDALVDVEKAGFARMRRIAEVLSRFSVASSTLIGRDELVSWPFATFAACLAQAVGRPVPPGFIACAVLPGRDDQPIPLLAV